MIKRAGEQPSGARQRLPRGAGKPPPQGKTKNQLADQHALTMLETMPDGLVNLDDECRFLYVNSAAERIIGQSRDELIGQLIWDKLPYLRGTNFERQLRKAIDEGARAEFEISCSRDAGYYRVLISRCVDGAMVLLREAAEQKKMLDALKESEAWRRLIIENVRDFAIFSMDAAGRVTLWNPGAEEMYGYTRQEMMGNRSDPIFTPEDREAKVPEKELAQALEHNCARDERWHLRKDGSRFYVSGAVVPLYDSDGCLVGFTKIARDITEKKQMEDELRTARHHLEDVVAERTARLQHTISELELFSYSISHDLRAPLRAMRSFAQILTRTVRDKLDPRSAEFLNRIVGGADRLDRLIEDVLNYSRVGRGQMQMEAVDIEAVIRTIIREQPSLDPSKAKVTIERPMHNVLAHKALLTQCISNLLTNAVKFVPPGTFPEVRAWTERRNKHASTKTLNSEARTGTASPDQVRSELETGKPSIDTPKTVAQTGVIRLWIEDNGIGIPEAHRERIFGIFQRTPEGEKYEGTGIGLAIVRRGVEAMGGVTGVESEPGKGSRFWLELPAAQGS